MSALSADCLSGGCVPGQGNIWTNPHGPSEQTRPDKDAVRSDEVFWFLPLCIAVLWTVMIALDCSRRTTC